MITISARVWRHPRAPQPAGLHQHRDVPRCFCVFSLPQFLQIECHKKNLGKERSASFTFSCSTLATCFSSSLYVSLSPLRTSQNKRAKTNIKNSKTTALVLLLPAQHAGSPYVQELVGIVDLQNKPHELGVVQAAAAAVLVLTHEVSGCGVRVGG